MVTGRSENPNWEQLQSSLADEKRVSESGGNEQSKVEGRRCLLGSEGRERRVR